MVLHSDRKYDHKGTLSDKENDDSGMIIRHSKSCTPIHNLCYI